MSAPVLAMPRRTRTTPFTARVEAHGVKSYTVYNHMLLATVFRSLEEDYWHLRENVQIWDVSCERQVDLRGPDAAKLIQLMTPRDMSRAQIGQGVYAPLVDETGGMINDPVALKLADDHYWVSIANSDVLLFAKGLALGLGLDVQVTEPDVCPLAVQGPKSEELMVRVFGEAVRAIRFFRFEWLDFQDSPFAVARSGWSKQGGFEIYVDAPSLAEPLWDALWQAGEDLDVRAGCPNLIERIEGGLLSYGSDMTMENNPLECGLERYCHLDGPDFLGKAALQKIRDEGPARMIRGVLFDGDPVPACREPWSVAVAGAKAGHVSSAVYSPRMGANIGVAMMDRGYWESGTPVTVTLPDGSLREGKVSDLPFPDPMT